jgi:hypothetical protein
VRDSTNANEENILRIENLPTGEGNGGEGTPVSPSTQADEPDTPTAAAGDDSTDTTAEEPAEEENSIKDVVGDLPGAEITDTDKKMFSVYGDYVHQNDGTHLDGGIADDAQWQEYWRKLVVLPPQRFDVPTGAVGRQFVETLTEELVGVRERQWNSERFFVFQMVILQRCKGVRKAGDIRRRIRTRMEHWKEGKYKMLVQDTVKTSLSLLSHVRRQMDDQEIARTYNRMVLQGKLRQAVRWITQRHKGGILYPDDIDIKTGMPVIDVLKSKHPEARVPDVGDLPHYDETPEFVDVDITADTVESVARKLSGSAGPGGIDSVGLSHLLLRFGKTSATLREAVADFTRWMANEMPPWAAYRAMIASRQMSRSTTGRDRRNLETTAGKMFAFSCRRRSQGCMRHRSSLRRT